MKSFDKKWEDMGTSSGEDAKKSYTCQNALGVGIPTTNIFAYGIF